MKFLNLVYIPICVILLVTACSRLDEDRIDPRNPEDFPIVIVLADDGDGDLEDSDEVGIDLEIIPVWDPVSRNIDGVVPTPTEDLVILFEVSDPRGFAELGSYILGADAFYEVDDCTDSNDLDIDLNPEWNPSSGQGSFTWPAGVEEVELVILLDEDYFNDEILNPEDRGFAVKLAGVESTTGVRVNTDLEFEYEVLDDEAIFGDWELDPNDPEQFARFLALFGSLNEDFEGLTAEQVDKIEISFGWEAMEVVVELLETEEDECEPGEFEALEIDVECEYDFSLSSLFGVLSGELAFEGEAEIDGIELEFELEGAFEISTDGSTLQLTLSGEREGEDIDEQTLTLTR